MCCWWECKLAQPLWKTLWTFFQKLKIELPYDPAIPLQDIYLKISKTLIQKYICILMSIAALLKIAKIWEHPKCPSINKWIKKRWYIYAMEYYSDIKKNEI